MASTAFYAKLSELERRFEWTIGELISARGAAITEVKPEDPSSLSLWVITRMQDAVKRVVDFFVRSFSVSDTPMADTSRFRSRTRLSARISSF